jgi:hypothetical protein
MSFLFSTLSHNLTTPIPGSDTAAAVALLHEHEFIIKCNPLITSHTLLSAQDAPFPSKSSSAAVPAASDSDTSSQWHTYEIVESIPHLGGVFHQSVTSLATFKNTPDGVLTKVKAPAGLEIESEWVMKETGSGSLELVEKASGACVVLLARKVSASIAKNYGIIHQRFAEELKKRGEVGGVNGD